MIIPHHRSHFFDLSSQHECGLNAGKMNHHHSMEQTPRLYIPLSRHLEIDYKKNSPFSRTSASYNFLHSCCWSSSLPRDILALMRWTHDDVSSFTRRQFILARHLAWKIINSIPSQEKDSIHNIKRMFDQALSLPVVPSPSIPSRQNSKRKIRSNPRQSDKIRRDETQLQTITGRSDSCQAYQMSGHWTTTSEISDRLLRSVRSIKAAETANLDRAEQGWRVDFWVLLRHGLF